MAPYDIGSRADPFGASTNFFTMLLADLSGPAAGGLAHHELEELLESRGRELLRQLLQEHLDLRAERERAACAAVVAGPDGRLRTRRESGHQRLLATLFGTVTVTRCAYRAPGAVNVYPADVALSLPDRRHSHGLAKLAVLEAVRGSFDDAKTAIARRCGPVTGKRQLEQMVVTAAADINAFYSGQAPQPCTNSTVLALSFDAKGVVMRPEALRPATAKAAAERAGLFRTRLASGEKPARKRMATLAVVYDADPSPRRPHDVIAPPGGPRTGNRTIRPGPHARGKWLHASIIDTPDKVITRAFDQAQARDPLHWRPWVVLVDGARHQLDLIQAEATRRNLTIAIVIDFIHVLEYLWGSAWCLHRKDDPAAEDWVAVHALALLAGDTRRTIDAINAQATTAGLTTEQRRGIDTCLGYLTAKQEFLHYDQALAAGWPIATGVIEGACRHLIGDRLDITGARWGLQGAEAILTLRALTSNGHLDTYWKYHLDQEHQRNHQDGYTLTT
jgi:hypothetical protein